MKWTIKSRNKWKWINTNEWENENEMHDNTYKDFCQNCVGLLGLQWNMKLKSKVEN